MSHPLANGSRQLGKYDVIEKIGEGGYSSVFRGFDPLIKRHVAIKSCATSQGEIRERFYREAEIAGNLDHPNIVRVYDLFLEDKTPYLVQELLTGEDLDDRIERREAISFSERLYSLIQIARGLDYAHQRGVVHRDIKPANVRVLEDGTVKILDFGIAQLVHYNSDLTQKGMAVGTAAYLAPEQIRGEKASPATDIFSFGVLAYELLTYVRPFGRETISETFYQTLNSEPTPLAAHWADCPEELTQLVERCMRKDADQRPRSCGEVLRTLEAVRDRMRDEWSPAADPARTQVLPSPLGPRTDDLPLAMPRAEPSIDHTRPMPRPPSGPAAHVDLPLRDRPSGMPIAGAGRRRRRVTRWIPVLAALAIAVAAWRWLPLPEQFEQLLGGVAEASSPAPPAVPPSRSAEPETSPPNVGEPTEATTVPAVPETPAPSDGASTPVVESPPVETASVSFEGVWSQEIQLSINGAPPVTVGRSQAIELGPGDHSLTFSLDAGGFRDSQTLSVRLTAGESKRIPVPISPPGRLTVQAHLGSPQGLVRIGKERLLRPTPLRAHAIRAGRHQLALFGHDDRGKAVLNTLVDIRAGHEAIVTFDLEGGRRPHVREKRIRQ